MNSSVIDVKISEITISERFRKDMGDLFAFAKLVEESELLHPIGITPEYELIFGERRLRIYRDVLGRETIPARIIPVKSVLLGQIAENIMRKSFTPSELVAIVQALRSFTHGGDRRSDQSRKCDDDALTTEEAARMVGLSKDGFARAQKVVEEGIPELVQAMDAEKLSVFAASEVAKVEPAQQQAFLERRPAEERWTGAGIRKQLRRLKNAEKRKADAKKAVSTPESNDAIRIYNCLFQELERTAELASESAGLFCTDIPYNKKFLPQVSELSELASRVLVDGGLFLTYCGQYWLPEVIERLKEHLTYRWVCADIWEGDSNVVHQLGIASSWKPILVFSKGDWQRTGRRSDVLRANGKEKDRHEWQQPLADVQTLIENFSDPGDLIVDPCGGSFTTAIACHRLNRRFVGCDIGKAAVANGQERLAEERLRRDKSLDELRIMIEDADDLRTMHLRRGNRPRNCQRDVSELWKKYSALDVKMYLHLLPQDHRRVWDSWKV